jgi:hypothetical protein
MNRLWTTLAALAGLAAAPLHAWAQAVTSLDFEVGSSADAGPTPAR